VDVAILYQINASRERHFEMTPGNRSRRHVNNCRGVSLQLIMRVVPRNSCILISIDVFVY